MKTPLITLLVALLAVSCGNRNHLPAYLDDSRPIETRVQDALGRMTDEEKTAMLDSRTESSVLGVPRLGIPGIRLTDSLLTDYPDPICLAATWDPTLATLYGQSVGAEARFRDVDVLLGPGVNILRTPLNGGNSQNFGEDPLLASRLIVPYIQGVQNQGVAVAVRHFALHNQQQDRDTVDVHLSDRALYEIYLPAFRAAVQQGNAWAIQTAPNRYNDEYCAENQRLLTTILKDEWGFDGAVVGARDEEVGRLLRLILRTSMNRSRPWGSLGSPLHAAASRAIAEAGVVLLKNSNDALPLDPQQTKKILVVGENAPLGELSTRFGRQIHYMRGTDEPLEAVALAAQSADAVVFFGGFTKENPLSDRDTLSLPDGQDAIITTLAAANPRTAVILMASGPVTMSWHDDVATILHAWHLGAGGDEALAAIITGEVNPSGRLPFTYYGSLSECGAHALGDYPGGADHLENYIDDIWVGYRYTDMKGEMATPAFPFGHGLSYTTFQYTDIEGDKDAIASDGTLKISVKVTNTGYRTGSEVVQLYVGDAHASVARPVKELKDFQKINLEPGRSKRIIFTIDASALSFFDGSRHEWVVEPGNFTAFVASSASDIRGVVEFSVL